MWKLLMLINSQATSYQSMDVEIDPQYRGGVKKQLIFYLIHFYQRLDRRQRNLDVQGLDDIIDHLSRGTQRFPRL